jgi:hypothetical protein
MRTRLLLLMLILVWPGCLSATAEAPVRMRVEAPPELDGVKSRIEAMAVQGVFASALALTGQKRLLHPVKVELVPESAPLARQVPAWVSGYAVAPNNLIVLFPARVRTYPDRNLRVLLQHEVAHLLVAQAAALQPVPRWFNEGIATVAAREWGFEDRARYAMAVIGKGPRSTAELDRGFAGDEREVVRSYALSAAYIRHLRESYGAEVTSAILRLVAEGMGFEEAFYRVTGTELRHSEKIFFHDRAFWSTWVPFLTSSGALWMAITALALLAIKRRRVRSRAMHEAWEQEEQALYAAADSDDPDWVN